MTFCCPEPQNDDPTTRKKDCFGSCWVLLGPVGCCWVAAVWINAVDGARGPRDIQCRSLLQPVFFAFRPRRVRGRCAACCNLSLGNLAEGRAEGVHGVLPRMMAKVNRWQVAAFLPKGGLNSWRQFGWETPFPKHQTLGPFKGIALDGICSFKKVCNQAWCLMASIWFATNAQTNEDYFY